MAHSDLFRPRQRNSGAETDISSYAGTSLVASAARHSVVPDQRGDRVHHTSREWQKCAWEVYDQVAEIQMAARLTANSASMVNLFPAKVDGIGTRRLDFTEEELTTRQRVVVSGPDSETETEAIPADDLLAADIGRQVITNLFGKYGQSTVLRLLVENLFVAGEVWLVQARDRRTGALLNDEFDVMNSSRVHERVENAVDARLGYYDERGRWQAFSDEQTVLRFIYSHPSDPIKPMSSVRSVLDEARNVMILRQLLEASALSSIHSGIMMFPNEMVTEAERGEFKTDVRKAWLTSVDNPSDESAVAPHTLFGDKEYIEAIRHLSISREFDETLPILLDRMERRLFRGLDLPVEIIAGIGEASHWCVDEETEILTPEGFKRRGEIGVGSEVLTFNTDTEAYEWQVVQDLYEADVADEPMISVKGKCHDSLTTEGHRWPVRDRNTKKLRWKTSKDFNTNDEIITASHLDAPEEAKHSDALVELMAWYWTEGGGRYIFQSHVVNPERCDRIEAALREMCGGEGPTDDLKRAGLDRRAAWGRYVKPAYAGHPVTVFKMTKPIYSQLHKYVPLSFIDELTEEQRELFIDISLQGDGRHYRQGIKDIWQKDPAKLDAIEYCALLAGYSTSRTEGGHQLCLLDKQGYGVRSNTSEVLYTGKVWCPVTRNGTWVARRNGAAFVTGNSSWQISSTYVRNHIQPVLNIILETITRRIYSSLLEEAGLDPTKYCFDADTTEIAGEPNRAKNAVDAYDRGVLRPETLLDSLGFNPAADLADPIRTPHVGSTPIGEGVGGKVSTDRKGGVNPDRPDENIDNQPINGDRHNENSRD